MNGVVGAGIFLLPGRIANLAGGWSWAVYVGCASLCFLVALCFAEMGSRYGSTGGAYRYARGAFGPFWGFLVGWIVWLSAVLGWASVSVGLADLLTGLGVSAISGPFGRATFVAVLAGSLAALNARGARVGALTNTMFSVLKLVPLALFVVIGAAHANASPFSLPAACSGPGDLQSLLLWSLFLYSGFEEVTVPAGETVDPQHTVPRALFVVLGSATVVYILVQLVAQAVFPALGASERAPLADAAQALLGSRGLALIGVGSVVSLLGTNASIAFTGPRSLYALAEDGFVPARLAQLDARFHAPRTAIALTAGLVIALPLIDTLHLQSFTLGRLLKMSALASLLQYIATCAATIAMRRLSDAPPARFRAPGGAMLPWAALALVVGLFCMADLQDKLATLVGVALGLPLWWLTPREVRQAVEHRGDARDEAFVEGQPASASAPQV